jgi:predicted Zn-dependent protease
VARRPDLEGLYYQLGEVLRRAGRPQEALAAYRDSARLDPAAPDTHYAIARALAELGRREEALAALAEGHGRARALGWAQREELRQDARVQAYLDPAQAASAWRRYAAALIGTAEPSMADVQRLAEAYTALEELESRSGSAARVRRE